MHIFHGNTSSTSYIIDKKMYSVLCSCQALFLPILAGIFAIVTEITLCGDYTWLLAHLTTALTSRQPVFKKINNQLNDIPLSPPGDCELEVKSELYKMHGPSGYVLNCTLYLVLMGRCLIDATMNIVVLLAYAYD